MAAGEEGCPAETVIICLEISPGDIVAVANLDDECHKDTAGKIPKSLTMDCETLATVDVHADKEPGIGRAKTILVYDLNDPEAGKCYNSEETAATNDDVMTNEKVGKHVGTDCHERWKVSADDSKKEGSSAKAALYLYNAGAYDCRYIMAELTTK